MKVYRYKLTDLRLFIPFTTLILLFPLPCVFYIIMHIKNAQAFYIIDLSTTAFLGIAFASYCSSRKPVCVSEEGIGVATSAQPADIVRWVDVKRIERAIFLSTDHRSQYYVVRVFFMKENRERSIMFEDRIGGYFGLVDVINDKIVSFHIPAYDVRAPYKSTAVSVDRFDKFAA